MCRSAWIVGLWLLAVTHAYAEERLPLELQWLAPAECPSADEVRSELERVARVRSGFSLTPLWARAEVEHHGTPYTVRLYTEHDGHKGERRLDATDCKTLVRTVTLVLALAFGTGVEIADNRAAPDETAPNTRAPTAPSSEQPPKPAAAPPPRTSLAGHNAAPDDTRDQGNPHALSWVLLLGGGALFRLMPVTTFSASAGIELDAGAFSIGLRTTAWPGVSENVAANVEARFDGLAGALQGCGRLPLATSTFALCGSTWAAALRGRASGLLSHGSDTAPWYALVGSVSLTWPRGRWLSARLEASLAASLDRPRFIVEGLEQVHRVPLLAPELGVLLLVSP